MSEIRTVVKPWSVQPSNCSIMHIPKGITVEVIQKDQNNKKSLVRFGGRDYSWISDSILNEYTISEDRRILLNG